VGEGKEGGACPRKQIHTKKSPGMCPGWAHFRNFGASRPGVITVEAEVAEQVKGPKMIAFKKQAKQNFARKKGKLWPSQPPGVCTSALC
jgi:hypothetical protein